jgi:hypothetical protein
MGARARLVSAGSEIKLNTPVNAASESVLVFNVTFKVATLTENRHNPCFHALTFTYGPVQYARHDPSCNMSPVHQDASTPRCRPLPSSSPARTGLDPITGKKGPVIKLGWARNNNTVDSLECGECDGTTLICWRGFSHEQSARQTGNFLWGGGARRADGQREKNRPRRCVWQRRERNW